jgi:hypothetical protein
MLTRFQDVSGFAREFRIPLVLALLQLAVQIAFHDSYGYFRDELYYLACSHHLAFGYVDQPPFSIALLRLNSMLLGDSLQALRFLPSLAGAVVVLLAAVMARTLGGSRFAQGLASLSVVAAPGLLGHGKLYTMNPFDVLFWTLAGVTVLTLLNGARPTRWLWFGLIIGVGLLNKYSIGFMVIGVVAGLVLTRQRRHLASRWFWLGAAVATVLFLPHVLWEAAFGFPSLEFMRNASGTKNIHLGPLDFLLGQIRDMNLFNAPLWLGGIYFFATSRDGRYRVLALMFPVIFTIMVATHAKVYYLSAIYPLFLAGGAVWFGELAQRHRFQWLRTTFPALVSVAGLVALPFALPVLPVDQFVSYEKVLGLMPRADERSAVGDLPQYYADQFGWQAMVDSIATAYRRLTPAEQATCVIYVRNYGEAGAVDFFGGRYGLPHALCAHNSYWMWGPGEKSGDVAIIIGNSRTLQDNLADLQSHFRSVELAATTHAEHCMPFEEGRMIFICRGFNTTFQAIWSREKFFI